MKQRIRSFAVLGLLLQAGTINAATLTGTLTPGNQTNVNLTTTGGIDWVVWGGGTTNTLAPSDSKSGGTAISDLTTVGNPGTTPRTGDGHNGSALDPWHTFDWTDGSPLATATSYYSGLMYATNKGVYGVTSQGIGFSMTAAGSSTQSRILDIYFLSYLGTTTITASLPGAAPVALELTATNSSARWLELGRASFEFLTDSPSDVLTITSVLTTSVNDDFAKVMLHGAALRNAAVTAIPEPGSTLALAGLLAGGMFLRQRKRRSA